MSLNTAFNVRLLCISSVDLYSAELLVERISQKQVCDTVVRVDSQTGAGDA